MSACAPPGVALALATLLVCSPAAAQAAPAVEYTEHLGALVPDAALRDEDARPVLLSGIAAQRPAIVALGYYGCSNLCSVVLQGVAYAMRRADLRPGRDVDVIAISIDPMETAALARQRALQVLGRIDAPGWHFLTGDEASLSAIERALGFRYETASDAPAGARFAHPAGIALISPQRRVMAYFSGVAYAPDALRRALDDARHERTESEGHLVWMRCFHYDPQTGRYTPVAMNIVRAGGIGSALALVLAAAWASLRRRAHGGGPAS